MDFPTTCTTGYRFSFNGMEKDDEVKGVGNSLDFGARIYDPRLGRWLSLDPLAKKYPNSSPYSAFADNPIVIVDKDGKENIIYLVVLPSAKATLKAQQVEDIKAQATQSFKDMDLKTEVRVVEASTFDMTKIDAHDAVAVMGSKSEVVSYVGSKLGDKEFSQELKTEWGAGPQNPEYSKNNGGAVSGNVIAIDGTNLDGAAAEFGVADESNSTVKAGALSIVHGAGHNAGQNHAGPYSNTMSIIMVDGDDMSSSLSNPESFYPKYKDVTNNQPIPYKPTENRNQQYVGAMKKRFGDQTAKDNRATPKTK